MDMISAPVLSDEEYANWRNSRVREGLIAHIRETNQAPIRIHGKIFYWTCPGCGGTSSGQLSTVAVQGWEAPRWVRSGPDNAMTLNPSLGCPRWRAGKCVGHYLLREGKLILI